MGKSIWTDEQKEYVKHLYERNTLNIIAKLVNDKFGTEYKRGAISGIINRMGISTKENPVKIKSKIIPKQKKLNTGIKFSDSKPHHCLYISNYKGAQSEICGKPRHKNAYCEYHCHIVYKDFGEPMKKVR